MVGLKKLLLESNYVTTQIIDSCRTFEDVINKMPVFIELE